MRGPCVERSTLLSKLFLPPLACCPGADHSDGTTVVSKPYPGLSTRPVTPRYPWRASLAEAGRKPTEKLPAGNDVENDDRQNGEEHRRHQARYVDAVLPLELLQRERQCAHV